MKIVKLSIHSFGRLKNLDLDLAEGFQLFYGPNEYGKSTIMAFIRAMFYGFSGGGRQVANNERKRYMPWDGQRMGGSIIFSQSGVKYRLERWFGKTRAGDQINLMRDITGEEISLSSQEEPGFRLLNCSENEFVNTVFIRQLESQISDADDLLTRLSNLAGTGDDRISHAEIDRRLRQAQTGLLAERGGGGRLNSARQLRENLEQQRISALADTEIMSQKLDDLQQKQKDLAQAAAALKILNDQAVWQRKCEQLAQWQRLSKRQEQLDQQGRELDKLNQSLANGDFLVTAGFVEQLAQWEQNWRNAGLQVETRTRQTGRMEQQLAELLAGGQVFASISGIDRQQVKNLQHSLMQNREAAVQRIQLLRDEVDLAVRSRNAANADLLLAATGQLALAQQNVQQKDNEKKNLLNDVTWLVRQAEELRSADFLQAEAFRIQKQLLEREQASAAKDHEDRQQECAVARTNLQEAEARHGQLSRMQPETAASSRQTRETGRPGPGPGWLILAAGVLITLAGILGGVLVHPLIWLAVVPGGILLGLQIWRSSHAQPRHISQQLMYEWQFQFQSLESDIRVAKGHLQDTERLAEIAGKNLENICQRLEAALQTEQDRLAGIEQKQAEIQEQKAEADSAILEISQQAGLAGIRRQEAEDALTALQAQIALQPPLVPDEADEELHGIRRLITRDEQELAAILLQSGHDDWNSLEEAQRQLDVYNGQVVALQNEVNNAQQELRGAQDDQKGAAETLRSLYAAFAMPEDIGSIRGEIDQLGKLLGRRENLVTSMHEQEQALNDLLDGRSWTDWQQSCAQIAAEMASLPDPPQPIGETEWQMLQTGIALAEDDLAAQKEAIARLENDIRHLGQNQPGVSDIDQKIRETDQQIAAMNQYYEQLGQARAAMGAAVQELQNSFGPELNENTARILSRLTHDKYSDVKIDRSFAIHLADPSDHTFHEWQYLSGGTVDQIYLALRVAIADLISSPATQLPLLFDDVLTQYDDARAEAAIDFLIGKSQAETQQVLFFTCQTRVLEQVQAVGQSIIELDGN